MKNMMQALISPEERIDIINLIEEISSNIELAQTRLLQNRSIFKPPSELSENDFIEILQELTKTKNFLYQILQGYPEETTELHNQQNQEAYTPNSEQGELSPLTDSICSDEEENKQEIIKKQNTCLSELMHGFKEKKQKFKQFLTNNLKKKPQNNEEAPPAPSADEVFHDKQLGEIKDDSTY